MTVNTSYNNSSYYYPTILGGLTNSISSPISVASMLSDLANGTSSYSDSVSGSYGLQQALDGMKATASRQRIMSGAIGRINGVADGSITPEADWEKTGGYMATFGMPFMLSISQVGKVEVTPQEDTVKTLPISQQSKLTNALSRLDDVRKAYDEESTKEQLKNTLLYAVSQIIKMDTQYLPAKDQWEKDFQTAKTIGRPMMVTLDKSGNLQVTDQINSNFNYVEDDDKRLKLQMAGAKLNNILNGNASATELWQYEALGNRSSKTDYFLDVDDSGNIVVRNNTDSKTSNSLLPSYLDSQKTTKYYIVPDYLQDAGDYDKIYKSSWEKDAMALYAEKKPYYLDVQGSQVKAKQLDYTAIMTRDILSPYTNGNLMYAQVSLLL